MLLKIDNKAIKEETWALIILFTSFIYLLVISMLSKGLYGDADSIAHYQLARYAFKYPYHFVDHWGKPLYTTLCAPFAQFGFQGAIFFNIFCGLITSWLVYRIAKKLNYRYALAAIPFTLFVPVYMINLFTGLTEILFALVLVAAIYFFIEDKNILSAVIISFIPYARTEGAMFLVIFFVAFVLLKNYKAIPFLLTGFVFYSIAGYFYYKDLFWFFTALPYSEQGSLLYGSGSFWYYLEQFHLLMGYPLFILAVIGIGYLIKRLFSDKKPVLTRAWIAEYYLITGSFFAIILTHSFLWWQGMMGVLASPRFMACIMPLGGLLALSGLNFILLFIRERKIMKILLITAIIALIVWMPYYFHDIPAPLIMQDLVMKETADAVRKLGYKDRRVIFFDPKFAFYLKDDPWKKQFLHFSDDHKPEVDLADGSLLIWDAHFWEVDEKLLLDDMIRNPNLKLIDGFIPEKDFRFAARQNYMSLIFQKKTSEKNQNEWINIDSIDFETAMTEEKIRFLTDSIAFTGDKSICMNPDCIYSFTSENKLKNLFAPVKVIVRGRVKVYNPGRAIPDNIFLVLSVHHANGEIFRYLTKTGSYYNPKPKEWFEMSVLTPLETDFPENGSLKIYAWYTGQEEIFVDDLILEYIPVIE